MFKRVGLRKRQNVTDQVESDETRSRKRSRKTETIGDFNSRIYSLIDAIDQSPFIEEDGLYLDVEKSKQYI